MSSREGPFSPEEEDRIRQILRQEREETIDASRIAGPYRDPLLIRPDIRIPWKTWVPTYTNLTVGANGVVVARYVKVASIVLVHFRLTFGSDTTIGGSAPTVSLPVPISDSYNTTNNNLGAASINDSGTAVFFGVVRRGSGAFQVLVLDTAATHTRLNAISATVPMTWTTGDVLAFSASYETL